MSDSAATPKKPNSDNDDLDSLTKAELIARVVEQDEYLKQIEGKRARYDRGEDDVEGGSASERVKQQQRDASRRENTLVHRLTTKEQELQDYMNQIQEMKQAQTTGTAQLRSMLLDPAVNIVFQRMGSEMDAAQEKLKQTQNELSAWKFTPDSQTGKRLMARCQTLLQENEELGKTISSGRTAKLEGEIALQKTLVTEMKNNQSELDEFLGDLEEDVEGMQTMILVLQQQLREAKEHISVLEAENAVLRGGDKPDTYIDKTNVSPKHRLKAEPQLTFRTEDTNHNNHTNSTFSMTEYSSMEARADARSKEELDMDTGYDEYYGGEDDYQHAEQNEYDYSENDYKAYEDSSDYKTDKFSNMKDEDYHGNNHQGEDLAMETDEGLGSAASNGMNTLPDDDSSWQPNSQTEELVENSKQYSDVSKVDNSREVSESHYYEMTDVGNDDIVGSTTTTGDLTSSSATKPREENIELGAQEPAASTLLDTPTGTETRETTENETQQPSYQTTVEQHNAILEAEISSTKRSPSPFVELVPRTPEPNKEQTPPLEDKSNSAHTHYPTKDKSPIRTRSRRTRSHKESSPPLENNPPIVTRTKLKGRKKSGEIKTLANDSIPDSETPFVHETNAQSAVDNSYPNSRLHEDSSPHRERSPTRDSPKHVSPRDKSPRPDGSSTPSTSPYKEREPVLQKFLNGVTSTVDDIEDL